MALRSRPLTAPLPAAFTDDGKVLKVALAGGVSHGPEVMSLEEISVTKVRAAGGRWLEHTASRGRDTLPAGSVGSHWLLSLRF